MNELLQSHTPEQNNMLEALKLRAVAYLSRLWSAFGTQPFRPRTAS